MEMKKEKRKKHEDKDMKTVVILKEVSELDGAEEKKTEDSDDTEANGEKGIELRKTCD